MPEAFQAAERPCQECPWRTDVAAGQFDPDRFVALAPTAYDMHRTIFQCHKTSDAKPVICAGFLARGADHNLTVRLLYMNGRIERKDRSGGLALHPSYRAMAIANGVAPDHPALASCREP